ncbi:MAG: hypothetical protein U0R52_02260 [Solirubrobacterales bacterium]
MTRLAVIGGGKYGLGPRPLPRAVAAASALLASLALLGLAAAAPPAHAKVYWADLTTGNIGRSGLDGRHVERAFIRGAVTPVGLTVAGGRLYWADANRDTIGRARLDGKGVRRSLLAIPDPWTPYDVAVDARHIYWPNGGSLIGRARIDGTRAQPRFVKTSPHGSTFQVAVNRRHLYWTTNVEEVFYPDEVDSIGRADPTGKGIRKNFIDSPSGPYGIAVHGRYIYWTNQSTNTISRARRDGTGLRRKFITTGPGNPRGIAVAGGHIYWTNVSNTAPGTIGRANLDGSRVHRSFIRTGGRPWDVAVVPGVPHHGRG